MNSTPQTILSAACGLDVHKAFVVAVIKSTGNDGVVQ